MEQQSQIPREAIAYLDAVRRHYAPGVTREPTNVDIAAAHRPALSPRGWDHRKQRLRDLSLGGRDWIEVWRPPRDWHPSWEPLLAAVAVQPELELEAEDGLVHQVYEEVYDPKDGNRFVARRMIKVLGHFGATAALFYGVLDRFDGRADESVQVARALRRMFETVAPWVCATLS